MYAFLESLAKLTPLGLFLIALTAIFIAFNQLRTVRKNEANKQYVSYLDDCIKYPKFFDYTGQQYEENKYKTDYRYFVAKMLMAFETILVEYPNDNEWYNCIYSNLEHHADYLRQRNNNAAKYSQRLQNIINDVIEKTPKQANRFHKPMDDETRDKLMNRWEELKKIEKYKKFPFSILVKLNLINRATS